jgi:hypothetical protein
MREKFKNLTHAIAVYWLSDRATVVGILMAVGGLAASADGAAALQSYGVPAWLVQRIAAAAVILGAMQIGPKNKGPA